MERFFIYDFSIFWKWADNLWKFWRFSCFHLIPYFELVVVGKIANWPSFFYRSHFSNNPWNFRGKMYCIMKLEFRIVRGRIESPFSLLLFLILWKIYGIFSHKFYWQNPVHVEQNLFLSLSNKFFEIARFSYLFHHWYILKTHQN